MAALRKHKQACTFLGEPVRVKALKLGDEENWVTPDQAQVRFLESLLRSVKLAFIAKGLVFMGGDMCIIMRPRDGL